MSLKTIYFANTTGLSSKQIERMKFIAEKTYERVSELIPISEPDLILHVKPSWTIPETGYSGFSPNAAYALIHLDPSNSSFDASMETELPATIAHELHHCVRYGGVGYGQTLLEALVTEGLACAFEAEFRQGQPPFYATALHDTQIPDYLVRAKAEWNNRAYNHNAWFFGSKELGIPPRTGYTLGYHLIKNHLEKTGSTAASEWNLPASGLGEI